VRADTAARLAAAAAPAAAPPLDARALDARALDALHARVVGHTLLALASDARLDAPIAPPAPAACARRELVLLAARARDGTRAARAAASGARDAAAAFAGMTPDGVAEIARARFAAAARGASLAPPRSGGGVRAAPPRERSRTGARQGDDTDAAGAARGVAPEPRAAEARAVAAALVVAARALTAEWAAMSAPRARGHLDMDS